MRLQGAINPQWL